MKVVHVLSNFLPDTAGGTEHYVLALCKGLDKLGVSSAVALPREHPEEDRWVDHLTVFSFNRDFSDKLAAWKADIVHFHEFSSGGRIGAEHVKKVRDLGMHAVVSPHVCGNSCFTGTMYQNNLTPCNGIMDRRICTACFQQTKRPGATTALISHVSEWLYQSGYSINAKGSRLGTALNSAAQIQQYQDRFREIVEYSHAVVGISSWYTDVLKRNFPAAQHIVHIPTGKIHMERGADSRPSVVGKLSIAFIGRITPIKGLHLLLEALSDYPSDAYILKIVGEAQPYDREYAETLKSTFSKHPSIVWLGGMPHTAAMQILANSDVLCLPSVVAEMSPLVIDEAHALGKSVLASDVPGSKEKIVVGENGWLFQRGNGVDLKYKINSLIDLHQQGAVGCSSVSSHSFDDTVQQYHQLYTKILNAHPVDC